VGFFVGQSMLYCLAIAIPLLDDSIQVTK